MASNYNKICEENRQRYGTEGAVKSGSLAAGLYDDRTHFIFELLQNAEDALGRRGDWHGPRKVVFTLSSTHLALSHFGKPFDEGDVRGVCDIAESTKNESSIGRFGLGFKSVYTLTELPEIHSGDEDFAIEDYVFPRQATRAARAADETKIILPLRAEDTDAPKDITTGFRQLGPGALLFLRHIDEISWNVVGGASGFFLRNPPQALGPNVHRISVVGQESGLPEVDQNWLVFHRDVLSPEEEWVGRTEFPFRLASVKDVPGRWSVHPNIANEDGPGPLVAIGTSRQLPHLRPNWLRSLSLGSVHFSSCHMVVRSRLPLSRRNIPPPGVMNTPRIRDSGG